MMAGPILKPLISVPPICDRSPGVVFKNRAAVLQLNKSTESVPAYPDVLIGFVWFCMVLYALVWYGF